MKILITDTHYGAWNNDKLFFMKQLEFIIKQLPKFIEMYDIREIIHLGDFYDNEKVDSFIRHHISQAWIGLDIPVIIICGNHDLYEGHPILLLEDFGWNSNFTIVHNSILKRGNEFFVPWTQGNNIKHIKEGILFTHIHSKYNHLIKTKAFLGHSHMNMIEDNKVFLRCLQPIRMSDEGKSGGFYIIDDYYNYIYIKNNYVSNFYNLDNNYHANIEDYDIIKYKNFRGTYKKYKENEKIISRT